MDNKNFNRQEYIDELLKRNARNPCHRCGHSNFAVLDGFANYFMHEKLGETVIGGSSVPVILVVCNNCGAITPHAVGTFKPFDNKTEKEVKNG